MRRIAFLLLILLKFEVSNACTAMLVGRKASLDGSTITTHNDDCFDCDFRLARIPAKSHQRDVLRPVYAARFQYPRYVGKDRGPIFEIDRLESGLFNWIASEPIGMIRQVDHTYSYLDGSYGIMNEHQLAIGESTCGAVLINRPVHDGGHALFDISELSRIAMERCKTARCAILTMGNLAVTHGFYGAEWEGDLGDLQAEAGEALTITDTLEAWIFHILPDGTDRSAVWVAQRVPDDHVSVVANMFVVRKIDFSDSENFLFSPNLVEVAVQQKLWNPDNDLTEFDFQAVYATKRSLAADHYYARRMWRFYDWLAPSKHFSSSLIHDQFPFSVKPDTPVAYETLIAINRDHYEGTPFDLTKGLAAGPYGNPNRYDRSSPEDLNVTSQRLAQGYFERAISMFRTSYSVISQSRHWLPDELGGRVWFANHAPHASVYVPFYAGGGRLPSVYGIGSTYRFNRDSAWWPFCAVENYAEKYYVHSIKDIQKVQAAYEAEIANVLPELEKRALAIIQSRSQSQAEDVSDFLSDVTRRLADDVIGSWWKLFDFLLSKYKDGTSLDSTVTDVYNPTHLFYPLWWLEMVGFWPDTHETFTPVHFSLPVTVASPIHTVADSADSSSGKSDSLWFAGVVTGLVSGLLGLLVGIFIGKRRAYDGFHEDD